MASESRNLAQQRREKDGIVYFERGILTGRDGRRYQRYAIQTHFVEVGESAAELVKKYVLPLAQPGDVILVAGKGHENYQEIKGVKHHFDDKEILNEIMC